MKTGLLIAVSCASFVVAAVAQADVCPKFTGSTMSVAGVEPAAWRVDYPEMGNFAVEEPWKAIDFVENPRAYMHAVLGTAKGDFERVGPRLVGSGSEDWWIVPWLDYTGFGREPLMGLTKERGPDPGDLSPSSTGNHQVWAVGFYNAPGAAIVGEIFENPCDPNYPANVRFPEGTVSIKFLFTDAPTDQVEYLANAPVFHAFLDPPNRSVQPQDRIRREVRLLQVDIAVRDSRADPVGWVFGTFAWIGLPRGDTLFDNLEPVALQWGDDPNVTSPSRIRETWINPLLEGVIYGWPERPMLGFHGRANGPADNVRSSCLSCHASARIPSAPGKRLLNAQFHMIIDLADRDKVLEHVDTWFINLPSGELFAPEVPAVSALDYSLQLDAAAFRMCAACRDGRLTGATPRLCRAAKWFEESQCNPAMSLKVLPAGRDLTDLERMLRDVEERPPRQ
jgi:hypothetical protein